MAVFASTSLEIDTYASCSSHLLQCIVGGCFLDLAKRCLQVHATSDVRQHHSRMATSYANEQARKTAYCCTRSPLQQSLGFTLHERSNRLARLVPTRIALDLLQH